jgi:hypothetical protein
MRLLLRISPLPIEDATRAATHLLHRAREFCVELRIRRKPGTRLEAPVCEHLIPEIVWVDPGCGVCRPPKEHPSCPLLYGCNPSAVFLSRG